MRKKSGREPEIFISGLIIGLFVGSAFQFLSSKEGRKLKDQLARQWRQARLELVERGLLEKTVPEDLVSAFGHFLHEVGLGLSSLKARLAGLVKEEASSKRSSASRSKRTKKRFSSKQPLKFKGV